MVDRPVITMPIDPKADSHVGRPFVMSSAELTTSTPRWLKIPKYTTPCVWNQGAKEWPQC